MSRTLLEQLRAARDGSVPIVAVETSDAAALTEAIAKLFGTYPLRTTNTDPLSEPAFISDPPGPVAVWDIVRGLSAVNTAAAAWIAGLGLPTANDKPDTSQTVNPTMMLAEYAVSLPVDGVLIMYNAHKWMENADYTQAVWNLRDQFKANRRMLVLMGPYFTTIPPELSGDVIVLTEPLPDRDKVGQIVDTVYSMIARQTLAQDPPVKLPNLGTELLEQATDAALGLRAFEVEQSVTMAVTDNGLQIDEVRMLKRQMIDRQDGLSV